MKITYWLAGLLLLWPQTFWPLEPGDQLPAFSLHSAGGNFDPGKRQNLPLLLVFWSDWCLPCRQELPEIEKIYRQGLVEAVGISLVRSEKDMLRFLQKMPLSFQNFADCDEKIADLFSISALPSVYLFDREGKLIFAGSGFSAGNLPLLKAKIAEAAGK